MKKNIFLVVTVLISKFSYASSCLNLTGKWEGICDRDGVIKKESLIVRQNSCEDINFYGIDYKIGMPYDERYENEYEKTVNIFNLFWGEDGQSLNFNVDRVKWMKGKNEVSTGEGIGHLKIVDQVMYYSRTYSARSRDGIYSKESRKCEFTRKK
ncbi:hypothetical protein [Bacteriovorax sp. Seq25_V]|uniref:hypothetical protein n=1 Tax=Bacteriovorax sp. Seq25_V TaxID=1201288 RepID=UPI0004281460|nr:hypothetical protein [Bacteriovorax sp. Seq25_V]